MRLAQCSGVITVDWGYAWLTLIPDADRVTVNVFEWLGPLNVPGYSKYLYRATGGAPGAGASKWLEPAQGGSLDWSSEGDPYPDEARIKWNGDAVVGRAVYQASPDYVWDLGVNVVEIDVNVAAGGCEIYPEPHQVGGPGTTRIGATNDAEHNAIEARLNVRFVTGPTVNEAERGKKFMEMGLSQQATVVAEHGDYNHASPPKRMSSPLEDCELHWDLETGAAALPFIDYSEDCYLNITSDAQIVVVRSFEFVDTPIIAGTRYFVYPATGGTQVDYFAIELLVWDYFIVRSKDPRVIGSDQHCTIRAEFAWSFNGSGPIDNPVGAWHKVTGTTGVFREQQEETFNEILDGRALLQGPLEVGTNLNDLLDNPNLQWSWENQ